MRVYEDILYQDKDYVRYYKSDKSHYLFDNQDMCLYQISSPNSHMNSGDLVSRELVKQSAGKKQERAVYNAYSAIIELTDNCNLKCVYCYRQMKLSNNYLSKDIANKIINHIIDIDRSKRIQCEFIRVIFFGGEPLLNFEMIEHIVSEVKSKVKNYKLRFSISTNGVLLKPSIIDFLCENKFNIQVSFEGEEKTQGVSRPFLNGKNSYDIIEANLSGLSNEKKEFFTVGLSVSKLTPDVPSAILNLIEQGFSSFNLLFVIDDILRVNNLTISDFEFIKKTVDNIVTIFVESIKSGKFITIHPIFDNLMFLESRIPTGACSSTFSIEAFGTSGNIYPCQRFLSMPEYSYGDVTKGYDEKRLEQIREKNMPDRTHCNNCWLETICSGKCAYLQAIYGEGEINEMSCVIQSIIWDSVIKGYIKLKEDAPDNLHSYLLFKSKYQYQSF